MNFTVRWEKRAQKELKKLPFEFQLRVLEVVTELQEDAFAGNATKLTGSQNVYRIRLGLYRVIYEVEFNNKLITIFRVRHRSKVYK